MKNAFICGYSIFEVYIVASLLKARIVIPEERAIAGEQHCKHDRC
jgi:hypothetical protein